MPYKYVDEPREKHGTFRTFPEVLKKLSRLAGKIAENKYHWKHTHPIRLCDSRSGLIHQVLSEKITMQEIRQELKKREVHNESD